MEEGYRPCRCHIPENLQKDQMYEKIAEYVANLEPEECAGDAVYEKRLEICSQCEELMGGLTCKLCGCFVLARAKKKSQKCPKPGKRMW